MYSKNDYRYYLENQLMHSDDFLSHYGVQGMHWGVRRYQPYSQVPRKSGKKGDEKGIAKKKAKQVYKDTKKTLRNGSRRAAKDRLARKISQRDYEEIISDLNSAQKYNKKLYKVDKARINHPDDFKETYKYAVEGLKSQGASADDYVVTSTHRNGYVKTVVPVWGEGHPNADVNRSVKLANHKRLQDNPTKADIIKQAKVYNMYDLPFLEAVQNKNLSQDQALKEYKKYLDDPHKYRTQTVNKLKDY